MKKIVAAILIFCSAQILNAQSAQSIYFELGGPGIASINFDSRFNGRDDGIGGRIGIGGFGNGQSAAIFVPLQLNYLLGTDHRHYFEIGAGATIVNYHDEYGDDGGAFSSTFGHLYFGYRLQPANGGFLFRVGINPVFGNGYFIPYYPAISFGYKFVRNRHR